MKTWSIPANRLSGWETDLVVQTKKIEPHPSGNTYRVYVNGKPVGYTMSQDGWWASLTSLSERPVYGVQSQRTALENLIWRL